MTPQKVSQVLSWLVASILVILPFHAFVTIWLSSAAGHYTLLRLWKEFALVVILAGTIYILASDSKLKKRFIAYLPTRLIALYSLVLLFWGYAALINNHVTAKAMWYGLLVDLRFLVFFLAVWVIASKSAWLINVWQKILLAPAIAVSTFAIAQYLVLPYDFLRHFGYKESTIFPYETINHNISRLRVASTLRGANPLGAYLVLPISGLVALLAKQKSKRRDGLVLLIGMLLAMAFSFSRSAWIGLVLSTAVILWVSLNPAGRKMFVKAIGVVALVAVLAAAIFHNSATFENTVLHTENGSKVSVSSNEAHASAFSSSIKDIARQPWGGGVGTAGPQSAYNERPARISENYFLQIGQEAGLIGMALFIAICAVVGKLLWQRRTNTLALWLFGALIGITFINLLSHAWADDTLAYLWWGYAGIALATPIAKHKH